VQSTGYNVYHTYATWCISGGARDAKRSQRSSRGIGGRPRNNSPRIRAPRALGAGGIIQYRAKTVIGTGQIIERPPVAGGENTVAGGHLTG
jgi:hypothetical protein